MNELSTHNRPGFWPDCGVPVAISIGLFCLVNFLWNWPPLRLYEFNHAIPVYMCTGGFVSLILVALAVRRGTVDGDALGLSAHGWRPSMRVFGLALIIFMGYGGYSTLPNVVEPPKFADYCFWFIFLLPATIAELLVFVSIGFVLPEQWLRRKGIPNFVAWLLAAVFSSVAFGLYHYTHAPRWHEFALYPLIPVMLINLTYFGISRNFHLTLLLHNSFAAVGFTGEQYRELPPAPEMNPATHQTPLELTLLLTAFLVPYLLLHLLEWRLWSKGSRE